MKRGRDIVCGGDAAPTITAFVDPSIGGGALPATGLSLYSNPSFNFSNSSHSSHSSHKIGNNSGNRNLACGPIFASMSSSNSNNLNNCNNDFSMFSNNGRVAPSSSSSLIASEYQGIPSATLSSSSAIQQHNNSIFPSSFGFNAHAAIASNYSFLSGGGGFSCSSSGSGGNYNSNTSNMRNISSNSNSNSKSNSNNSGSNNTTFLPGSGKNVISHSQVGLQFSTKDNGNSILSPLLSVVEINKENVNGTISSNSNSNSSCDEFKSDTKKKNRAKSNRSSIRNFFPVLYKPPENTLADSFQGGREGGLLSQNPSACEYCNSSQSTGMIPIHFVECHFCWKFVCEEKCGGQCWQCGETYCGNCSNIDVFLSSHEVLNSEDSMGGGSSGSMDFGGGGSGASAAAGGSEGVSTSYHFSTSNIITSNTPRVCIDCQRNNRR